MNYEYYDSDESDLEFGRDIFHPLTYKENVISEILKDKLYLSDMIAANDINNIVKYNIKGIISIGNYYEHGNYLIHKCENSIEYLHIFIDDWESEPIHEHFQEAFNFIDENEIVLVHCWAGISRSATIVIAYLMDRMNFEKYESINYVRKKRTFICPNSGFLNCLNYLNEIS